MDDPGDTKNITQIQQQETSNGILERIVTNVGDVLLAFWLRCTVQSNYGRDRIVLGCRYSFLLHFRIVLFILYLAYAAFT